ATVHHVDRAADRAAAVEQGRRALEHFDLVGQERFDRHRVVDAHRRYVARGQPVAQHLDAGAVQATDHGPAHARPEVRGLHAGQPIHRFAQAHGPDLVQPAAGQHLDRTGQVLGGARQGGSPDHDVVQVLDFVVTGVVLGGEGGGGEGEQDRGAENGDGQALEGAWVGHWGGWRGGLVMLYYYAQ